MSRSFQQRKRIYLGCEGPSEQSYGKRLNEIADTAGLSLHLDCDVLQPGGGDPLALVQLAVKRIREKTKKRGTFAYRAILLDRDRLGQTPDRDGRIPALAIRYGLCLIWQDPCHEAFLLRHFEGQADARPASSTLSHHALKRVWPAYEKPMPASELVHRITLAGIQRICAVEAAFAEFLTQIRLPID